MLLSATSVRASLQAGTQYVRGAYNNARLRCGFVAGRPHDDLHRAAEGLQGPTTLHRLSRPGGIPRRRIPAPSPTPTPRRRLPHLRVVPVRGPVRPTFQHLAGAGVNRADRQRLYRDAVLHRAGDDAPVAGDALGVDHLEDSSVAGSRSTGGRRPGLVGRVLAPRVAAAALDVDFLVDEPLGR